jgi:hypothetical protein
MPAPYFPNLPWKPTYGFTVSEHAGRLDKLVNDTLAQIGQIAQDTKLSDEGKSDQLKNARAAARMHIDEETEEALRHIDLHLADQKEKARVSFTPSAAETGQLEYTLKALQSRWQNMAVREIKDAWKAVLDVDDQISLRVYRDFVEEVLREKMQKDNQAVNKTASLTDRAVAAPTSVDKSWPPRDVSDLLALTDRALLTEEQRTAQDALKSMDAARAQVKQAAIRATHAVTDSMYDKRSGRVLTHHEVAAQKIIGGF